MPAIFSTLNQQSEYNVFSKCTFKSEPLTGDDVQAH